MKKKKEKTDFTKIFTLTHEQVYGFDVDESGKKISRICKRCGNAMVASRVDFESTRRIIRETKEGGMTPFYPSKFHSHGLCPRCLRTREEEKPKQTLKEWQKERAQKDRLNL